MSPIYDLIIKSLFKLVSSLFFFKSLKVIILGGHIDSWDVGTGSMDDGAGVMIAWQVCIAHSCGISLS